jgi:hypothetical protein
MNKRLVLNSLLAGLLVSVVGCACDNGGDPDAGCGDGGCIVLTDAQVDSGGNDAGDAMVITGCQSPPLAGRTGGTCLGGTRCATGLTCFEELTVLPMSGTPVTLGNAFGIPAGVPDPAHEGEFIATVESTIPIGFAPGGQCSEACDPTMDTGVCGECGNCSTTLGGSDSFGAVGISVRSFDTTMRTNDVRSGICRANCVFNAETNGGCPVGYTCDVGENVCVEACVTDSQCNLNWGTSQADGLVAYEETGSPYTCNSTTGRCEWADAGAYGADCESNLDCPADIGVCLIGGHCATYQCNLADATGMAAMYPCPTDAICVGIGGNDAAFCLDTCVTPADCFAGQACSPQSGLPGGATGLCFGICESDAECRTDERCRVGGFSDPTIGTCQPHCDPTGADCATDEACVQVTGQTYGFCQGLDQLCAEDGDCTGGQACRVNDCDFYGRCEDGCTSDTQCTVAGEVCHIQAGSATGVCRAPGGACCPPRDTLADVLLLRGNPQCVPAQTCSSTMADVAGTCMGTVTPPVDAGVGADAGTATDAGSAPDAGIDAG